MSRFWHITSFIDVILPFWGNFWTYGPCKALYIDFKAMSIMVKVVQYDQRNILKKFSFSYHIPILTYDVIQPSICRFSVIFLLNLLTFWDIFFSITCPIFDIWRHVAVILPFSVIFDLNSFFLALTWFLSDMYLDKIYSAWSVIHLKKIFFMTSFKRHFAVFQ